MLRLGFIGVRWLTSVIFIVGLGDSIINPLPIRQRFLLDIAGADRVDISIDYGAGSTDQFDGIFEMRAVVGV